jgi:hypothetical protein
MLRLMQSNDTPIAEAFFDVVTKDARFDISSPNSGKRLGYFSPEGVIPWRPEEEIPAKQFGSKKPKRVVPRGYASSKDEAVLIYDESIRLAVEMKSAIVSTNLEVMWCCPEPEMGPAVVTANVRLRDSTKWQQMSYSLKESAIR